jgi:hypothetical protein
MFKRFERMPAAKSSDKLLHSSGASWPREDGIHGDPGPRT